MPDPDSLDRRLKTTIAARALCHRMGDQEGEQVLTDEIDALLDEMSEVRAGQAY